jgi:gas vesicle protein
MKAFITGVAIGICAGMIFAPESGKITRQKLKGRLDQWHPYDELHIDDESADACSPTVDRQPESTTTQEPAGEGRERTPEQKTETVDSPTERAG